MADAPAANPGESSPHPFSDFTEASNYDSATNINEAAFVIDFTESEVESAFNPASFLQWSQFPRDQTDSSQVTTNLRADHLQIIDQQFQDKDVLNCYIPQDEPEVIFPLSGAGPTQNLLPNIYIPSTDEPWNRCDYALDSSKEQYSAPNIMPSEGSASYSPWMPLSIEPGTLYPHNTEQIIVSKKRHLDTEDGNPSPFRRQKTAAHERPNKDQVGTGDAIFFESWLSNCPDIYPGPEHFNQFAGLTHVRTEIVQAWFSKRLRNGPQSTVAANPLLKSFTATDTPNSGIPQMKFILPSSDQPVQQSPDHSLTMLKLEASNWAREHKVKKCCKKKPPSYFIRDPQKPFFCTVGCGAKFDRKHSWTRHEEQNYPQRGWICNLGAVVHFDGRTLCAVCGISNPKTEHSHGAVLCSEKKIQAKGRLFFRKKNFTQHFDAIHPGIPREKYLENGYFTVKSRFPRRCGICHYLSNHWQDRIDHIAGHMTAGQDMSQWNFGVEDDHENSDSDGGYDRKRSQPPDDESDSSEDDRNDFPPPPKSTRKKRRQNTQYTYAGQAYSRTQTKNSSSVNDNGRTAHIEQGNRDILLNESFRELYLQCPEPEKNSCTPFSITTTIQPLTTSNKPTRIIFTKTFLKSVRTLFPGLGRPSTVRTEVKSMERLRYRHMSQLLRICEDSTYIDLQTSLPSQDDLAAIIQSYADTLVPSSEAIDRWSKLLMSGTVNNDSQTVTSATRYAPTVRWNTDISSLTSNILGIWRLLVDEKKAAFEILLMELSSSSALYHENYAQFQEWISMQTKNGNAVRKRMACRALILFDAMLTMRSKDSLVTSEFLNYLYSGLHPQPIEEPLLLVLRNPHSALPISIDATPDISIDSDVQSVSSIRHNSEVSAYHSSISQDDHPTSINNPMTVDVGGSAVRSTQLAVPNDTFCEMPDFPLFPNWKNRSSSFSAETNFKAVDCGNPTADKTSYPTGVVAYTPFRKPLTERSSLRTMKPEINTNNRGKGRRRGPLSPEARKKIASMRSIRACWHCWAQHIRCSTDTICTNCERKTGSPMKGLVCFRERISDYTNLFLPELIASKYSDRAIQVASSHRIAGFTSNQIEILITTGLEYPPLSITACEFAPLNPEMLEPHYFPTVELDYMPAQIICLDAPPLALWKYDPLEIRDSLLRNVRARTKVPLDTSEAVNGEIWVVSLKIFAAINKYLCANDRCKKDPILELAFELYATYRILSRPIIIEPSSALQKFAKLQKPHVHSSSEKILGCKILNLQLKHQMVVLLREWTLQLLRGLECTLSATRGKHKTWSTAFCLHLVLCLCAEDLEVAVDAAILGKKAEVTLTEVSRTKYCEDLEQAVFKHIHTAFMFTYKSHKSQGQRGFNPIRDGLELSEEQGINLGEVELVQDLRRIMGEHEDEINDRAKNRVFEADPSRSLEEHRRFREQNSGRLLSRYLLAFL